MTSAQRRALQHVARALRSLGRAAEVLAQGDQPTDQVDRQPISDLDRAKVARDLAKEGLLPRGHRR